MDDWLDEIFGFDMATAGSFDDFINLCEMTLDRLAREYEEPDLEAAVGYMLAQALMSRDAAGDLDRAIDISTAGVAQVEAGGPIWATLLSAIGDGHLARFTRLHRPADFAAAQQALGTLLTVGAGPERSSVQLRLGSLFEDRFRHDGDAADHREALEILRAGWARDPQYPLLAVSYADAVINSTATSTVAELEAVISMSASLDATSLPEPVQPQWHYLVMMAYFRRATVDGRRDAADLRAAATEAGRLIEHPAADPGLRAEARVARATATLGLASISGDRAAEIEPILADLTGIGPQVNPALRNLVDQQLSRVLAERARRSGAGGAEAEAFAVEALGRLPEGSPEQAEVRYHLAVQLLTRAEAGAAGQVVTDRGITLLEQVVANPDTAAKVRAAAVTQLATATATRAYYTGGDLTAVDTAVARTFEVLTATSRDDTNRVAIASALATALLLRYEIRGDLADLRWSIDLLDDARSEATDDPHHHELTLNLAQARMMWSEITGEPCADSTVDLLADVVETAQPGDPRRLPALRGVATGYVMRAQRTGRRVDWESTVRYTRDLLAEVPSNAPFTAMMRWSASGLLLLAGRALDDPGLLREAVEAMDSARSAPVSDLLRGRYLSLYGMTLLALHSREPRPGDVGRAVQALREAYDLANAQPGRRGAAEAGLALAAALADHGDRAASVETGRAALRSRAWQVLLQSGTQDAMTAARQSAADALWVARTALSLEDRAGAWSVLETGRGLVLHAGTVSADVPELLRRAGAGDLADGWNAEEFAGDGSSWRDAAPAMPSDARFRALGVLDDQARLLEPPPLEALTDALATMGVDALVYLCPGSDGHHGLALIIEPDGRVDALDLPGLTGDWAVAAAVQQAVTARDVGAAPDRSAVGRTLDEVCAQGWSAAIRPLLDHWHAGHAGEPHLVLVPSGALAAVPWHATHGEGRWAIDEAVFSYIASARLLIEVAHRTAPPLNGTAIVIGNPDTGNPAEALPHAGAEAGTIFRTHYAAGRYCGRPDHPSVTSTSPGTPNDVRGWLTSTATPVLHLACHGAITADGPASSYLLLADRSRVSAEEIIRAATARPAGHSPGLVSLAACTTHRAGRAYDEAVTLSTAFLVAGATTTIGSLWAIPDAETVQLMVAFHDNLAAGESPAEALRAAQRAMRDQTPLSAWSAFVHLGW